MQGLNVCLGFFDGAFIVDVVGIVRSTATNSSSAIAHAIFPIA